MGLQQVANASGTSTPLGVSRSSPAVAGAVAQALRDGRPTIRVMEHALAQGRLVLELVPLRDDELRTIVARVRDACMLTAES